MSKKNVIETEKPDYQLHEDGTFVIENYNQARPFASFFPGISGLKGIPMWVFYVNRGQGIASFGIKDKNYSLQEFQAANNAYALASTFGFRTFIKIKENNKTLFYEPFQYSSLTNNDKITQKMLVRPHEVLFEEINQKIGLKVSVRYFTLPNEPVAALVRIVEIENIGKKNIEMEVIDGLPKILPYYMGEYVLKHMSYTAQAWETVTNLEENGVPFYKLKVEINDRPEVTEIKKGNFYFGVISSENKTQKAEIVVDPELVFGYDSSFKEPHSFINCSEFKVPSKQSGDNKYPSAMSFFKANLAPSSKQTLYSMAGHIESEQKLNQFFNKAKNQNYFTGKALENKELIEKITRAIHTESGIREFDLYCKQTYLDNLMRGGMPILIPAGDKKIVFYVYSRKHGDIERDYNFFQLSPSYYSQGNGNYRDMNQNKRSDIFFNPQIKDFNVISFYNLIQLDGCNPLVIKGSLFYFDAARSKADKFLNENVDKKHKVSLEAFFSKSFEPGDLLLKIEQENIKLKISPDEFLSKVLSDAEWINEADHGEGYWVDHWTYNIDLLESYLSVYPENEKEILFNKKEFTFYDNDHIVVPRARKYVDAEGKIRQFNSVVKDEAKSQMIKARKTNSRVVRDQMGKGQIYKTNLAAKMICLMLNKLATLDSDGIGIEMESEKPGWYDALNGLPGIFGSSVCETFELKRMMQFMQDRFCFAENFYLPEEVYKFFIRIHELLEQSDKISSFEFWDKACSIKEEYRKQILFGVSGKEISITNSILSDFLNKAVMKINEGLKKAVDKKTGLYYTYFSYEALSFEHNGQKSSDGWPCVNISKFRRRPLPHFLEAEVHYLKTENDSEKAAKFHKSVKQSVLYDKNLEMYKVTASLKDEPSDIGRCTVFAPGWLENESIWLHMEYKYILELLKSGLYKEFFNEFKKTGVCFQDPSVYGRSILENSSFIASSAFPDKNLWGRGFVARLSGSTAEFIEMWLLMTIGSMPFKINDKGELVLQFKPAIPAEYFTQKNIFSFVFMGKALVTYHNPERIDTFSKKCSIEKISINWCDGGNDVFAGNEITGACAERIRLQEADTIDVFIKGN